MMKINGLTCTLNMPEALKQCFGANKEELAQALPPYAPRQAFVVDEYPASPESWIRGSAKEASYFIPVLPEHGLWLDFNENRNHTYQVAVLISIQGVNAITGQKVDKMRLEQYRTKCPVHDKTFGHERFCEQCGYKWDAQNYLASNATPYGFFWLDGFRAEDGVTRQFVFTKEKMRGIAAQIIGQERVFAIGIAFFLSKEPKPAPAVPPASLRGEVFFGSSNFYGLSGAIGAHHKSSLPGSGHVVRRLLTSRHDHDESPVVVGALAENVSPVSEQEYQETVLEIAAGAKIDQRVYPDPEKLEFWQEEATGIIYINYVDEKLAKTIIQAGRKDMTAGGEGFMQDLKVGHPV